MPRAIPVSIPVVPTTYSRHDDVDDTDWSSSTPPQIDISQLPDPVTTVLGEPASLTVLVTGSPPPTVYWLIGRKKVKESSRYQMTVEGRHYSLNISKVTEDLEHGVHIVASNDAGEDTCVINIRVTEDNRRPSLLTDSLRTDVVTASSHSLDVTSVAARGDSTRRRSLRKKSTRVRQDGDCRSLASLDNSFAANPAVPRLDVEESGLTMDLSYESSDTKRRVRRVKASPSRRPKLLERDESPRPKISPQNWTPDFNSSALISDHDNYDEQPEVAPFTSPLSRPTFGTFFASPQQSTTDAGQISPVPPPLATSESRSVVTSKPPIRSSRRRVKSHDQLHDRPSNGLPVSPDIVDERQETPIVAQLPEVRNRDESTRRNRRRVERDTEPELSTDDIDNVTEQAKQNEQLVLEADFDPNLSVGSDVNRRRRLKKRIKPKTDGDEQSKDDIELVTGQTKNENEKDQPNELDVVDNVDSEVSKHHNGGGGGGGKMRSRDRSKQRESRSIKESDINVVDTDTTWQVADGTNQDPTTDLQPEVADTERHNSNLQPQKSKKAKQRGQPTMPFKQDDDEEGITADDIRTVEDQWMSKRQGDTSQEHKAEKGKRTKTREKAADVEKAAATESVMDDETVVEELASVNSKQEDDAPVETTAVEDDRHHLGKSKKVRSEKQTESLIEKPVAEVNEPMNEPKEALVENSLLVGTVDVRPGERQSRSRKSRHRGDTSVTRADDMVGRYESQEETTVAATPSDSILTDEQTSPDTSQLTSADNEDRELWKLFGCKLDVLCSDLLSSDTCLDVRPLADEVEVRAVDELCLKAFGHSEEDTSTLARRSRAAGPVKPLHDDMSTSRSSPPPPLPSSPPPSLPPSPPPSPPHVPPPDDIISFDDEFQDGKSSADDLNSLFDNRKYRCSEPPNQLITVDEIRLLPNVEKCVEEVFDVGAITLPYETVIKNSPKHSANINNPDLVVDIPAAKPSTELPPTDNDDSSSSDSDSDSSLPPPPPIAMQMSLVASVRSEVTDNDNDASYNDQVSKIENALSEQLIPDLMSSLPSAFTETGDTKLTITETSRTLIYMGSSHAQSAGVTDITIDRSMAVPSDQLVTTGSSLPRDGTQRVNSLTEETIQYTKMETTVTNINRKLLPDDTSIPMIDESTCDEVVNNTSLPVNIMAVLSDIQQTPNVQSVTIGDRNNNKQDVDDDSTWRRAVANTELAVESSHDVLTFTRKQTVLDSLNDSKPPSAVRHRARSVDLTTSDDRRNQSPFILVDIDVDGPDSTDGVGVTTSKQGASRRPVELQQLKSAKSEEMIFDKKTMQIISSSNDDHEHSEMYSSASLDKRKIRNARSVGNLSCSASESSLSLSGSRSLSREWQVVKTTTKEEIIIVSKPDEYKERLKEIKDEFERKKGERKEKDEMMLHEKAKQEKERLEKLQDDVRKKREKQKQEQAEKQKAEKLRRQEQDKLFREIWEKKLKERKENEEKANKERNMKVKQLEEQKKLIELERKAKLERELAEIEEQRRKERLKEEENEQRKKKQREELIQKQKEQELKLEKLAKEQQLEREKNELIKQQLERLENERKEQENKEREAKEIQERELARQREEMKRKEQENKEREARELQERELARQKEEMKRKEQENKELEARELQERELARQKEEIERREQENKEREARELQERELARRKEEMRRKEQENKELEARELQERELARQKEEIERKEQENKEREAREMQERELARQNEEMKRKEQTERERLENEKVDKERREKLEKDRKEQEKMESELKEKQLHELREQEETKKKLQLEKDNELRRSEELQREIERKEQEQKNKIEQEERERQLQIERAKQQKEVEKQLERERKQHLEQSIREMKERLEKERQEILEREMRALRDRIDREIRERQEAELRQVRANIAPFDENINLVDNTDQDHDHRKNMNKPKETDIDDRPIVFSSSRPVSACVNPEQFSTEPVDSSSTALDQQDSATIGQTEVTSDEHRQESGVRPRRSKVDRDQPLGSPSDRNVTVYEYSEMLSFWREEPPEYCRTLVTSKVKSISADLELSRSVTVRDGDMPNETWTEPRDIETRDTVPRETTDDTNKEAVTDRKSNDEESLQPPDRQPTHPTQPLERSPPENQPRSEYPAGNEKTSIHGVLSWID